MYEAGTEGEIDPVFLFCRELTRLRSGIDSEDVSSSPNPFRYHRRHGVAWGIRNAWANSLLCGESEQKIFGGDWPI